MPFTAAFVPLRRPPARRRDRYLIAVAAVAAATLRRFALDGYGEHVPEPIEPDALVQVVAHLARGSLKT